MTFGWAAFENKATNAGIYLKPNQDLFAKGMQVVLLSLINKNIVFYLSPRNSAFSILALLFWQIEPQCSYKVFYVIKGVKFLLAVSSIQHY